MLSGSAMEGYSVLGAGRHLGIFDLAGESAAKFCALYFSFL
jgi:hypothetical protein